VIKRNITVNVTMSKRWRVYCEEPGDEGWQYIWSDTAPTGCPNDAGHSYNANSIKQIGREVPLLRLTPHTRQVKGSNYTEIATVSFNPDDYDGTLRRIQALSYMDTGTTSYDIEVFDLDNNVQLITNNFTNASEEVERNTSGVISSPPTGHTTLEINVKKTGGNNKKYARVEEIIFYFGVDRTI
jgi:hypothetical protein